MDTTEIDAFVAHHNANVNHSSYTIWRGRGVGRREESGPCDGPEGGILACRWSGASDAPRTLAGWTYHDHGGEESYRWSDT